MSVDYSRVVFISALLLLGGCGGPSLYTPNPNTFRLDSISEFSSNKNIDLVNSQVPTEEIAFASNMGHDFVANRKAWTDTAVTILQRELSKRGMKVERGVQKRLALSVQNVNCEFGFSVIRCFVYLKAETGDEYTKVFIGDNRSPHGLFRAADGAVMRVVTEVLRDQEIVRYLKE